MKPLIISLLKFLLLASLFLGPLVVMADELMEETNKLEHLTPEQAMKLPAEFPGVTVAERVESMALCTPGCLPPKWAEVALCRHRPRVREVQGPYSVPQWLDRHRCRHPKAVVVRPGASLYLNGLKTLDVANSKVIETLDKWVVLIPSIVAFECPGFRSDRVCLATRSGPLCLPNLTKNSPQT